MGKAARAGPILRVSPRPAPAALAGKHRVRRATLQGGREGRGSNRNSGITRPVRLPLRVFSPQRIYSSSPNSGRLHQLVVSLAVRVIWISQVSVLVVANHLLRLSPRRIAF